MVIYPRLKSLRQNNADVSRILQFRSIPSPQRNNPNIPDGIYICRSRNEIKLSHSNANNLETIVAHQLKALNVLQFASSCEK